MLAATPNEMTDKEKVNASNGRSSVGKSNRRYWNRLSDITSLHKMKTKKENKNRKCKFSIFVWFFISFRSIAVDRWVKRNCPNTFRLLSYEYWMVIFIGGFPWMKRKIYFDAIACWLNSFFFFFFFSPFFNETHESLFHYYYNSF